MFWGTYRSVHCLLVGLVVAVARHDDGALELVDDGLLDFLGAGRLVRVPEALLAEAVDLLVNEVQAVVNRQIFADVVDDEIKATLENPRGCEESRPGLHGVIEDFGLAAHEKARVSADLAKI